MDLGVGMPADTITIVRGRNIDLRLGRYKGFELLQIESKAGLESESPRPETDDQTLIQVGAGPTENQSSIHTDSKLTRAPF